jgi:hypothetical protein
VSDPARWTQEEYDAHMLRFGGKANPKDWLVTTGPLDIGGTPLPKRTQPTRGKMNKCESLYAEILEGQRIAGNVIEWEFEPGPLLLEPKRSTIPATRYWRDFRAVMKDGTVQAIEVKAGRKSKAGIPHPHFEDGARERLQMAAKKFVEYEWYLAWYYVGTWNIEKIK